MLFPLHFCPWKFIYTQLRYRPLNCCSILSLVLCWKALASHQIDNRRSFSTTVPLLPPVSPGGGSQEGEGKSRPRSFGFCPSDLGPPPRPSLPACLAVKEREASLICCEKLPGTSLTHGKVTWMASCCLTKEKNHGLLWWWQIKSLCWNEVIWIAKLPAVGLPDISMGHLVSLSLLFLCSACSGHARFPLLTCGR